MGPRLPWDLWIQPRNYVKGYRSWSLAGWEMFCVQPRKKKLRTSARFLVASRWKKKIIKTPLRRQPFHHFAGMIDCFGGYRERNANECRFGFQMAVRAAKFLFIYANSLEDLEFHRFSIYMKMLNSTINIRRDFVWSGEILVTEQLGRRGRRQTWLGFHF